MNKKKQSDLLQRWVRPEIQALSAYAVPDATGLIKLDAMENPYTWPDDLRDEWLRLLRSVDVNRYPNPQAPGVTEGLRDALGLSRDQALLLGNGSDELIQMIALTLASPDRTVLSVDPGFVMYRIVATVAGMRYVGVPLRSEGFGLDLEALLSAIERHEPAVVFLAYPNNPTGNLFSRADLLQIIEAAPGLVVIDEAYAPFTDASFIDQPAEHENLLVMRTLSKMGLAGLRLGYLVGSGEWIREIDKTRLPYNINALTQASTEFALKYKVVFEQQTRNIRLARERLFADLRAMESIEVFPSEANFILTRMPEGRAGAIHSGLKGAGVLVKNLDGAHPLLNDCLRVTVGTPDENRAFLNALRGLLRST